MAAIPFHPAALGIRSEGPRTADVTLRRMAGLVNRDVEHIDLRDAAVSIVDGIDGRDVLGQLAAIDAWLREHTRFLRDPVDDELLQTPRLMLAVIARAGVAPGDCDDVAMLGAALAKAIGIRARFVAESYLGPAAPLQHVYTVVLSPEGWRALDVQRPSGLHFPALRRIEQEV